MPGSGHGCLDLSVFFVFYCCFFSFFFKALFLSASPASRRLHFLVKSGTIQLQSPSAFISALWCSASVLNKVYYLLKLFAQRTCEPLEEGWFATKVGRQDLSKVWYWQVVFLSSKPSWAPCRDIVAMPKGARPISILGILTISILSLSMASERIVSNKRLLLCFFFCSVYLLSPSIVRWGWTTNSPRPWARTCEMWGSNGLKRRRRTLSLELAWKDVEANDTFYKKDWGNEAANPAISCQASWVGAMVWNCCMRSPWVSSPSTPPSRTIRKTCSKTRCDSPGKIGSLGFQTSDGRKTDSTHWCCKVIQNQGAWSPSLTTWSTRKKTCESERQMASTCLCSACQARLPQDAEDCGGEIWYHDCGSGMGMFKI